MRSKPAARRCSKSFVDTISIDDEQARPTYAELARSLGITATAVTNHLAAMRKRFRQLVLDRLRDLTSSDEEWEAEATRLLGADDADESQGHRRR